MRRIAILPGDGIGPEVIDAAVASLPGDLDLLWIGAGADRFLRSGDVLLDEEVEEIGRCDALLVGAVGDPRVPDGVLERGILLRLRRELDLYVNVRPFEELGIVFVRENTEGLYSGLGSSTEEMALEVSLNNRGAVRRCIRYAFDVAEERAGRVTLVHKTNVLTHAGTMWKDVFEEEGRSRSGMELTYEHVDAAAYHLVRDPGRFDVIVTDNLFGDILSDLAAGVGSGLGHAASANLHPSERTRPTRCVGLFEPVHGSAPDIAGTGTADPAAAIAAAHMMLHALQQEKV